MMPTTISFDDPVGRVADGTMVPLDAQAPGWFEREHLPGAHRINWDDRRDVRVFPRDSWIS